MSERKPVICPWCGGEMKLCSEDWDSDVMWSATYCCIGCKSTSPEINCNTREDAEEAAYAAATRTPRVDENTSDGYHTFKELYHHRAVLFAALIAKMPEKAWKSKQHSDGTMYDGMFIVGIETPDGQATYHYDIDPYWGLFRCRELDHAPEWDGHTPAQAIDRIERMTVTPPNRPMDYKTIYNLTDREPVWRVDKDDDVIVLGGYNAWRKYDAVRYLYFAANPSPADIEAARKERSD